MNISFTTILGMLFALGLVCLTGMYAGRKVTSAADFTTGSNMSLAESQTQWRPQPKLPKALIPIL